MSRLGSTWRMGRSFGAEQTMHSHKCNQVKFEITRCQNTVAKALFKIILLVGFTFKPLGSDRPQTFTEQFHKEIYIFI